tara:strand:- start:568 stop:1014 length:447 start_codon:yes stop_codon:yes gene_type:complete
MKHSWQKYFLEMAEQVATRSKDPSTKVGCVISTEDKVVVATGYNGIPRDVLDKPERMERPAKYLWTSHAEENAVAMAARVGSRLRGGHAFVTHMPCCRCARMLIQAGISTVYCGDGTTSMPLEEFDVATQMFREAGVLVVLTKQEEEV